MSCEMKSCVFVKNESIKNPCDRYLICAYFTPDSDKMNFSIMDRGLIMDNMLIMDMHRSSTDHKWKHPKTVLNQYFGGFWCETERMTG